MKKKILLSVALPLYRAEHVAWIALESLCRQSHINFEWELLIAEENYKEAMGSTRINEFGNRLSKVGCHRIEYVSLKKWIPLSDKWKLLAGVASKTSVGFVLQSADCYSNSNRLSVTLNLFKQGADWVHSRIHLIYDMLSDKYYTYARKRKFPAADMAIRTYLVRDLPEEHLWKGIDSWLYSNIKSIKESIYKEPFCVLRDESDNWMRSLNVHGLNNISHREKCFGKKLKIVEDAQQFVNGIPSDIIERIKKCKKYVFSRKLITSSMVENKKL